MRVVLTLLRHGLWLLCLTGLLGAQASGTAPPLSTPYAGWLDRSGTATPETVQQQAAWEPFTGWKGWGFGLEPVWLRVQVPAAEVNAAPQVLIVRPPYLDKVTFYDPATGTERRAGDFFAATDDALGSVLFTFEVPALPVAREVLVKVESSSTRVVHLSLMPLSVAKLSTRWVEWATGSVLLLSMVLLVWAITQWRLNRDRVMGFFAIKQLVITVWGFLFLGFARVTVAPLFPDGVLTLISSSVVALVVSSVLWFFSVFLVEYKARPWLLGMLRAMAWVVLGLALLNFAGLTHVSLRIINTMAPLLLLLILLTLATARTGKAQPPITKGVLLGYLALYAVLNAMPAMIHAGLLPESPILFLGNMTLLVADGLVMLIILNARQRRFNAQHQAVATQLVIQQEQARLDHQYLEDQRKLLAMLAHEMKTPLANLRTWMEAGPKGRPVMERAILDMNRVIERCVHAGQLSDQSLKPRHEWLDAAERTQALVASSRLPERVRMTLPSDGCAVRTDAQMLSIVLSNVLENAYKYSAPDTLIDVALSACPGPGGEAGSVWRVENVAGTAGLPDAIRVFDKYYRSPHAQRQSGSGLGLFLVKSLVELMGGNVHYTPLDGRARFEVWLPCEPLSGQE
jgi:two-component system, sensor histidine kinase LadS